MSALMEKQGRFAQMVAALLQEAAKRGYVVTLGEAWRSPQEAARQAAAGAGIAASLHRLRLAIDINLFKGGAYLSASEDYRELGEWWESVGGSWGGRFSRPDGNHFSLEHEGRK